MKVIKILGVLLCLNFCLISKSLAFSKPIQQKSNTLHKIRTDSNLYKIAQFTPKEIELLTGRKLSLKDRITLKILKRNFARSERRSGTDDPAKLKRKALWAKWLGIGSLIGLFVPGLGLLSLPAAIIAVVFGADTVNELEGQDKKNARQGITFGIITLSIFLVAVLIIIALISLFTVH